MRDFNKHVVPIVSALQGKGAARTLAAAALLCCTAMTAPAFAEDAPAPAPEEPSGEIVVTGSLGALPIKGVGTVFGFDKTLVETPRSASSVSAEQMERFGVTQIYDLVSQVPGTFTSSFFGTGGALDVRGSPSDVYFRGMQRLDNPGNYSTPIGAAERIDIVRGPASVIYGPSKIGGYMNFVPKTARAADGSFASDPKGYISYDGGSWGRNVLKANVTGPGSIGGHEFGYSVYGEVEDSDSYYRHVFTRNALFSAAFDTNLGPNLHTEFGVMYQKYNSVQNGGWNRLTQDLVDHGTYITGSASTGLDTDGDGKISREESYAASGGNGLVAYGGFACGNFTDRSTGLTDACLAESYPDHNLSNVGTTHLSRKNTLTGRNDRLNNTQKTAYFDLIWDGTGDLQIKNQFFYDGGKNLNENGYGFSQRFKSYVVEDKIVLSDSFKTSFAKISVQAAPSLRYTHFNFGDDFGVELWNRPDISVGYTPDSTRLLSTECDCDYSDYVVGHYTDLGMAGLIDADFDFGLDIIAGARYDHIHAVSNAILDKYDPRSISDNLGGIYKATANTGGWSWNTSVSYKTPVGIIPYVTVAQQSSIVAGEGSEVYPKNVAGGNVLAKAKLLEGGIKGEFLDKRLYAALAFYKQKRTDPAAESALTNQTFETKGIEAEVRWSVNHHLLVTGSYTHVNVVNLSALAAGYYFNYFGAGDLTNVTDKSLSFGGSTIGSVDTSTRSKARRPGIPKNVVSGTATYAFDNGIAVNADLTHVDSVFSSYSQAVKLPAYWLLNVGGSYTTGHWLFRAVIKNANNARYFRAGGQDLFGADIVLPQTPRSYQATIQYKF